MSQVVSFLKDLSRRFSLHSVLLLACHVPGAVIILNTKEIGSFIIYYSYFKYFNSHTAENKIMIST